MDPGRQDALRPIVEALRVSRRAGMCYLSRQGQTMKSGYAWPWPPPGEEAERELRLKEIVGQLDHVPGPWRIWYVEDGLEKDRYHSWIWPEQAELFAQAEYGRANSWPGWAFDGSASPQEETPRQEASESPAAITPAAPAEASVGPTEPQPRPGKRYSRRCAQHILALLEDVGQRLTSMLIADEFARRNIRWSESTLDHTLAEMVYLGQVNKDRDERGVGFGLPKWRDEDAQAEE